MMSSMRDYNWGGVLVSGGEVGRRGGGNAYEGRVCEMVGEESVGFAGGVGHVGGIDGNACGDCMFLV